ATPRIGPRTDHALRSVFGSLFFAATSGNSASVPSERICFGGALCSSSPSLMAFLNPRTACPRSEPTLRSFFAPNTTSTTSRITTSSRIPKPPILHDSTNPPARRRELDDRSNEPPEPYKFAAVPGRASRRFLNGSPARTSRDPHSRATAACRRQIHLRKQEHRRCARLRRGR